MTEPRRHRPKIHKINTLPAPECKWGYTNQQIGQALFLSPRTIETHLTHVFAKLEVSSTAAVAAAIARWDTEDH